MRQEVRHGDVLLDASVAEVAFRQHGVISVAQLRAAGVRHDAVRRRVERGELHRLHRAVYAVGHRRISARGWLWAAILACGGPERAMLSHRSAAAVWDLMPQPRITDVTTTRESRSQPGIRVHRGRPKERATIDGLPATSPTGTLLDLATVLTEHRLERVCHRAEQLRLPIGSVEGRGAKRLRRVLERMAGEEPQITRSELEDRFLALVDSANVPAPRTNARVLGYEADFLWPDKRLIVETDGAATHLTPAAFERDRARDRKLTLAGYRVVRFTWRQVVHEPHGVAAELRGLISSGAR
jgi:very-short-patch-repair endonuclease